MKNKQFTLGAILSYGTIALNIVSNLLFTPWIIHTLGNDQYALYALAVSVINMFLLDFGISSAVVKFLSNYYARGQYQQADRFMGIVYKVFLIISAVIALGLAAFYFLIDAVYAKLTPGELVVFKHLFLIVAAYSVFSFPFTAFNGVLSANERFIEQKACDFLQKATNVGLILLFLLMGKGVYALVLVHAFTRFVFLLAKYLFIRRSTKQRASFSAWDGTVARSLVGFSFWTTVMNLAQRCIFNIVPSIIAALFGSAQITLFSLACTLEGCVYTFANAVNGMLIPKVSRVLERENVDRELTGFMTKIGRYQICTVGLLYIGFLCLGREFVGLWMGEGYELVYSGAALLIFPSLFSVPQQVADKALLLKDVVKEQAWIHTAIAVFNVILSVVFLMLFGIVGASVSICLSYLLSCVWKNLLYHKKLPIKLNRFFKQTYGKWILVAAATLGVYTAGIKHIPLGGWPGLLVKAAVMGACYLLLYLLLGLSREERHRMLNKLGRHRNG